MRIWILIAVAIWVGLITEGGKAQEFHGYPCTVDCSGHEAGYEWAETNDIDDADDCVANSSFKEGCEAYVEENHPTENSNPENTQEDGDSESH